MDKIIVYIEQIDKEAGYLLIDFPPKSDINQFAELFFSQIGISRVESQSTMLQLFNVRFDGIVPRDGCYYELPDALSNTSSWNNVNLNSDIDQSSYVALNSNLVDSPPLKFGNALKNRNDYIKRIQPITSKEIFSENQRKILDDFNIKNQGNPKISLLIHNVGLGNYNEIFIDNSFLIYDLGSKTSSIFVNRLNSCFKLRRMKEVSSKVLGEQNNTSSKLMIISHWDIDHYNGLLKLSNEYFKWLNLILVPDILPTETSRRAFNQMNGGNIVSIEMRQRNKPHQEATRLEVIYSNNFLKLFRGSNSSNRNNSGLLIILSTQSNDVILPGDHSYEQLDLYLAPSCTKNSLFLVVPHHGRHAGDPTVIQSNNWKRILEAFISVDADKKYPYKNVLNALKIRPGLNNIFRTDLNGTIIRQL